MSIKMGDISLDTVQFDDYQVIIAPGKDDLEFIARILLDEKEWDLWMITQKQYLSTGDEPSNTQLDNDEVRAGNE